MDEPLAKAGKQRFDKLDSARSTWKPLWQSCARYTLPNEASFQETVTPGVERTRYILDSTAPRSLEMFGSFLHTLLNNPATRWIKLGVEGENPVDQSIEEKKWFEDVENTMLAALAGEQADIYAQLHQVYLGLGAFGTAVMFVDKTDDEQLRVRQYHLDDCCLVEGESELIDGMLRKRKYTRRQALAKWPNEDLGDSFKNRPNDDETWLDEEIEFLHMVVSKTDGSAKLFSQATRNKETAYLAAWINVRDIHVIKEEVYEEFPYIAPRWYKARGEIYGRSQTMTAMPDIRMVNRMSDTILRGAEKIVDPPIVIPDGGLVSPVRLSPGGITYSEGTIEPKTLIPPGTSRIETGNELLKQRQQSIREAYFVPLFITPDSPVKTATQTLQEVDERNRAVSPMLVRIQSELFHRLVRRVYGLLSRGGRLPPMPTSLNDPKRILKVEFTSPLVASQRQLDGLGVVRLFETMASWAQVKPEIFDNIDGDEVGKVLHAASAAPASLWLNPVKRDEVRKARTDAMQKQQQLQQMMQGGDVAAKMLAANNAGSK